MGFVWALLTAERDPGDTPGLFLQTRVKCHLRTTPFFLGRVLVSASTCSYHKTSPCYFTPWKQNHRMLWVERDPQDHLVPAPLPRADPCHKRTGKFVEGDRFAAEILPQLLRGVQWCGII